MSNTPWRPAAAAAPGIATTRVDSRVPVVDTTAESNIGAAFDEMLRGRSGILRWDQVPELVVLLSVMEYKSGTGAQYHATRERLDDDEARSLVADLSAALALLTDDTFTAFSSVHFETVTAGTRTSVMRPGQIVVGRYKGVRDQLDTIGLGGRFGSGKGIISGGSIVLDSEYDDTGRLRHLLRAHELGHTLGYNHVESRPSIMNPRIGREPTAVDRQVARMAFRGEASGSPPCLGP